MDHRSHSSVQLFPGSDQFQRKLSVKTHRFQVYNNANNTNVDNKNYHSSTEENTNNIQANNLFNNQKNQKQKKKRKQLLNNQSSLKNINITGVKFDDTVSEENNGYSSRSPSKIALKNLPLNILQ